MRLYSIAALTLFLAAAPMLASAPATAQDLGTAGPYVPADASPTTIIFIDLGAKDYYQGRTQGVAIIMQLGADGAPVGMIGGLHMDCQANTMAIVAQTTIDRAGHEGKLEYFSHTQEPQAKESMGYAMIQTLCTGESPNKSTKGLSFGTLAEAWDFGRSFLTRQASQK